MKQINIYLKKINIYLFAQLYTGILYEGTKNISKGSYFFNPIYIIIFTEI